MTRTDEQQLTLCLSSECRLIAEQLLTLQERLSPLLADANLNPETIACVQSLDIVQQSIQDIGKALKVLVDKRGDPAQAAFALAAIQQVSFRDALKAEVHGMRNNQEQPPAGDHPVEIW